MTTPHTLHSHATAGGANTLPGGAPVSMPPVVPQPRARGRMKWWVLIVVLIVLIGVGVGAVWQIGVNRFCAHNVLERYTQSLAKGDYKEALNQYRGSLRKNVLVTDVDKPISALSIHDMKINGETAHATVGYLIGTDPFTAEVSLAKDSTWLGIFPRWTITDGLETPLSELFESFGARDHGTSAYTFGGLEVQLDPSLTVDGKDAGEKLSVFPGLYHMQPASTKYFTGLARQAIVDPEGKFTDPGTLGMPLSFDFRASDQLGKEASDVVVARLQDCANRNTQDCPYPVGGNYITAIEVNANNLTADCDLDGTTFTCETSTFTFNVTTDISNEMFTYDPTTSGGQYKATVHGAVSNDSATFDDYIYFTRVSAH